METDNAAHMQTGPALYTKIIECGDHICLRDAETCVAVLPRDKQYDHKNYFTKAHYRSNKRDFLRNLISIINNVLMYRIY
jgi:hypothetical protein